MNSKKTLWNLIAGQRTHYSSAILAMGLANVFMFGPPLIARYAIDGIIGGDAVSSPAWLSELSPFIDTHTVWALWLAALAMLAMTAGAGVFLYFRNALAATAAEAIIRQLRDALYRHLQALPCAYHDQAETGDLVQRCTSDVETVRIFLTNQVLEIGRTLLFIAMVIPLLFWLDTLMALVSLALLPAILGFAYSFFRKVQARFQLADEAEARMTTVLQENLTGVRIVRAFARQNFECAKFARANKEFRHRNEHMFKLLGVYWAIADFLCVGQICLVLLYGSARLLEGTLSVGDVFVFLNYLSLIVWPLRQLGQTLTGTGKALVSLRRLEEILSAAPESDVDSNAPTAPLTGAIECSNLSFSFGDKQVLHAIDLRIKPGEVVALIGPPGAGKSTLMQLLLRLYDYQHGSIRMDGRELSTLNRQDVRAQIGVVLQEPFLYSKTIAANLQVGRPDADQQALKQAAITANIHHTIGDFGNGYETLVGERGVTLSGGQRQRLALARALLKDPAILILDDALSAVDTRTEAAILSALRQRRGHHTTLIIAHRLSTVAHADQIAVLQEGRIVQSGKHHELLSKPGPYRRLWQIQDDLEASIAEDLEPVA